MFLIGQSGKKQYWALTFFYHYLKKVTFHYLPNYFLLPHLVLIFYTHTYMYICKHFGTSYLKETHTWNYFDVLSFHLIAPVLLNLASFIDMIFFVVNAYKLAIKILLKETLRCWKYLLFVSFLIRAYVRVYTKRVINIKRCVMTNICFGSVITQ